MVDGLFEGFKDIVNPSKVFSAAVSDVEHHIQTTGGPPITSRFHRMDPDKLAAAKAEFLQLQKDGIVQWPNSSCSSLLHMMNKQDGSWRPCCYFRQLNTLTWRLYLAT
jgi:hypothetical protein